ncbi:MAG TPA: histidine kinase [Cellulomonas sp.]
MTRTLPLRPRLTRVARVLRSGIRRSVPTGWQTAVTLLWLLAMVTTATVRTGRTELPGTALWVGILGAWAPLLLRTYRPLIALVGTVVAESMIMIFLSVPGQVAQATEGMGAYQPVPLATMLAVATVAARAPRLVGWVAGFVAGGVLMVIGLTVQTSDTFLTDLVVFYVVLTAAMVGVWRSGRRERTERVVREREEHAQHAVLDERLRIARELHDVLAHNLTLVNAQAGVARYLVRTDVDAAERALRDITTHTARAIDELRATIGLLRRREDEDGPDDADGTRSGVDGALRPVPGLAGLDALVSTFRSAGARVDLTVTGNPGTLAQHADLAAYRILQESLTNAAKHAPGSTAEVALAWTDAGVRLRVSNPAAADPDRAPAPGTGNGLIGMRERATSAGGSLRAGPSSDGGFEVVATLPAAPAGPAAATRTRPATGTPAPAPAPDLTATDAPTGEPRR